MDEEYKTQLTEQLRALRRLQHGDEMTQTRYGISCEPSILMRIEDRAKEIRAIEARLGIEWPAPPAVERRYEPAPRPRQDHEAQIARRQERARQNDVAHEMNLLETHRANMAHYRRQARAYGGTDLAPPITQHGINEARVGIAHAKRALDQLGVAIDNLPGDE